MKKWVVAKWVFEILSIIELMVATVFFISLWFDDWNLPTQLVLVYVPCAATLLGWFLCLRKLDAKSADVVELSDNEVKKSA